MMVDRGPLRSLLHSIAMSAIGSAKPAVCMAKALSSSGVSLQALRTGARSPQPGRIALLGMGKASAGMGAAIERQLGTDISDGLLSVPEGYQVPMRYVEVVTAGHPIPDQRSLDAGRRILQIADSATEDDVMIVLVSGGGSALAVLPADSLTLGDLLATTELLVRSGADIHEVNAVRKHLSQIKGGHLARHAFPARVVSFIMADVPFDVAESVASGPTAPDSSTFLTAQLVLEKYGLLPKLPSSVRKHLRKGIRGEIPETPKPNDAAFERVCSLVVASGKTAVHGALAEAEHHGIHVEVEASPIVGDAAHVGDWLANKARSIEASDGPRPSLFVGAGETTVRVTGHGQGGRNQEVCVAAARGIEGMRDVAVCALATDGIDGPTDAAGAIVDGESAQRIRAAGFDLESVLAGNNSYPALRASDDLIVIGPTGTNVSDLFFVLVG